MMKKNYTNTIFNTAMLYLLTAAKTLFPLITLPYLTRVLSAECYGVVAYVKAIVSYAQIITDFGFMYSAVKDIVEANSNKEKISSIIGNTVISKMMLSSLAFIIILIISGGIHILNGNMLFLSLSMCVPLLSCFLMDFLFRGIEKMHIITIIFVLMKTISTVLTVIFIQNDNHIFLIPIFDIISSVIAIVLSWIIVIKLGYKFHFTNIKDCLNKIKVSFGYFANSMASSAFGTLNTVVIGFFIPDAQQIAYWSVCMQLVGAIQNMYTPISNGIYPYMIKNKDFKFIKKILCICLPVICVGAIVSIKISPLLLTIIAGDKYIEAAPVFQALLPVIIMSFPVAILGWPALGAINKVKETTTSTILGALSQVLGLVILIVTNNFTLINIAILRGLSELVMLSTRGCFLYKYKQLFTKERKNKEE